MVKVVHSVGGRIDAPPGKKELHIYNNPGVDVVEFAAARANNVLAALTSAPGGVASTLFIVSAGNDGSSYPHYPAHFHTDYANVLAVSALKHANGAWMQASAITQDPDLATGQIFGTPGVHLSGFGSRPEATGTSFAASVASAVAALTLERFPNLSPYSLRSTLLAARDV